MRLLLARGAPGLSLTAAAGETQRQNGLLIDWKTGGEKTHIGEGGSKRRRQRCNGGSRGWVCGGREGRVCEMVGEREI